MLTKLQPQRSTRHTDSQATDRLLPSTKIDHLPSEFELEGQCAELALSRRKLRNMIILVNAVFWVVIIVGARMLLS